MLLIKTDACLPMYLFCCQLNDASHQNGCLPTYVPILLPTKMMLLIKTDACLSMYLFCCQLKWCFSSKRMLAYLCTYSVPIPYLMEDLAIRKPRLPLHYRGARDENDEKIYAEWMKGDIGRRNKKIKNGCIWSSSLICTHQHQHVAIPRTWHPM